MIKIETTKSFLGFGDGTRRGECFYSEGMHYKRGGIKPGWEIREGMSNNLLPDLLNVGFFSLMNVGGSNFIYCVNRTTAATNGKIFRAGIGGNNFSLQHIPTTVSYGNGLISDQRGRLLYLQTRFLGMFDGSTWIGNWRDFGFDISPVHAFRPADLYEDWVVMGNQNRIALLNVTDDSFNSNAFNLPSGFLITAIKSNRTGVLIGANIGERGVLILWDCLSARSIAPWIWLDDNISSICPMGSSWVVSYGNKLILTNGYTTSDLPSLPDLRINDSVSPDIYPSGMAVKDDYLFVGISTVVFGQPDFGRRKQGLWILNLSTKLWEFCPVSNRCLVDIQMGGFFLDNQGNFYIGYSTTRPQTHFYIARVHNSFSGMSTTSNKAIYISETMGRGNTIKVGEAVLLNLNPHHKPIDVFATPVFQGVANPNIEIAVKLYDFKRILFRTGITNSTSTILNQLRVDGSLRSAISGQVEVGDEVTILQGANAGEIRHITSITNRGTVNETWTLDSNLPNLTSIAILLEICPFVKIGTQILNTHEMKDYYFDAKGKVKGKKFLIKVVMTSKASETTIIPEITECSFVYNDLGIF